MLQILHQLQVTEKINLEKFEGDLGLICIIKTVVFVHFRSGVFRGYGFNG